ncbi:hypothetical protein F5B22DRAFT_600414 [Xylaria bambusicola]|uniref:uncharacterized protein n=1 Tax=Xylaria bambusicola TaxID=326684 RepID=UPI00200897F5|nr:uncharacterized protein F5B22DRAFT_600414 [Xylaria bambusicola]KAI0518235.1 hypothetical protein F5B22DRAFT_600414 [Xylaria bambusicola]
MLNEKGSNVTRIIDNIPENNKIKQVVCVGLSQIAVRFGEDGIMASPQCLDQHLTVLEIAHHLSKNSPHGIDLFAVDCTYDDVHKRCLEDVGFGIFHGRDDMQQHGVRVDNNTLLIVFALGIREYSHSHGVDYEEPVAIIFDVVRNHAWPPSLLWEKVRIQPSVFQPPKAEMSIPKRPTLVPRRPEPPQSMDGNSTNANCKVRIVRLY